MQVTIHMAKVNLSKLIEMAQAGEEVIIVKGKVPIARIVPMTRRRFTIGLLKGKVDGAGPDFFEPKDDDELTLWEAGGVST